MSESESVAKGECVCGRRPKDFVSKYGGGSADGLKSEPAPTPYPNQTRDYNSGWREGFIEGFEKGRGSRPGYGPYNRYPWPDPFMWVSGTETAEAAFNHFPHADHYI